MVSLLLFVQGSYYPGRLVGYVESIQGPAYIICQKEAPKKLDPKKDVLCRVHIGDTLYVGDGGKLVFSEFRQRVQLEKSGVRHLVEPPQTRAVARYVAALEDFGEEAVRTRHGTPYFDEPGDDQGGGKIPSYYSPYKGAKIMPDGFTLGWNPKKGKMNLSLSNSAAKVLWSQKGVSMEAGILNSEPLRAALRKAQQMDSASEDVTSELTLTSSDTTGKYRVKFRFNVMEEGEVNSLQSQLAEWDEEIPLLRHLSRALTFLELDLPLNAAKEYDQALLLAPDSVELLDRARRAHLATENEARVKELETLIRKLGGS